jgi:hypothetical protein
MLQNRIAISVKCDYCFCENHATVLFNPSSKLTFGFHPTSIVSFAVSGHQLHYFVIEDKRNETIFSNFGTHPYYSPMANGVQGSLFEFDKLCDNRHLTKRENNTLITFRSI